MTKNLHSAEPSLEVKLLPLFTDQSWHKISVKFIKKQHPADSLILCVCVCVFSFFPLSQMRKCISNSPPFIPALTILFNI